MADQPQPGADAKAEAPQKRSEYLIVSGKHWITNEDGKRVCLVAGNKIMLTPEGAITRSTCVKLVAGEFPKVTESNAKAEPWATMPFTTMRIKVKTATGETPKNKKDAYELLKKHGIFG